MAGQDDSGKPRQQPPAKPAAKGAPGLAPARPAAAPARPAGVAAPKPGAAPARPAAGGPALKPGVTTAPPRPLGGPVPGKQRPARRSESAFELQPVTSGPWNVTVTDINKGSGTAGSSRNLPRVGSSDFENTATTGPRSPSMQDLQRISGASARNLPQVGDKKPPPVPSLEDRPTGPLPARRTNVFQKALNASGFDEEERTQTEALLGHANKVELDADEEEDHTAGNPIFDGEEPAPGTTARDTWKATTAPLQNRPGRRAARVYWSVIDQFAVGNNPRYDADPNGKARAHIFVWDVTRAMGCEVPHMVGGRELTVGLTVDWLRVEGPGRGWRKVDVGDAAEAADRGEPVVAVPKDPKQKLMAVVRPGGVDDTGHPRVASANLKRGNDLGAQEALGTQQVDYFWHE